ncbi:MAG: energy transducer TonB [Phycisphaerales bacterium]|nr:energy transducer TonB [Phycisphaerales bacterium]
MGGFIGIVCAILLHVGFILFGGLLFLGHNAEHRTLQEVELISDDTADEEKPPEPEPQEELEAETEGPPDAAELMRNLEQPNPDDGPAALDPSSLSAIAEALNGQGGGGDFMQGLDFTSGKKIGGTGRGSATDEQFEGAFSLAEIDQKPRVIFQSAAIFPAEMRGKKIEGVVSVMFVVDSGGKVANPRVETSTHPAFDKPAVDAVKKWKFEPAVKGGKRVACKMRVPIRFQPS